MSEQNPTGSNPPPVPAPRAPQQQINFRIEPDDRAEAPARVYANFSAVSYTPFDFTLTFCEVEPPTAEDLKAGGAERVLRAPVKVRVALPPQAVPALIHELQHQMRMFSDSTAPPSQAPPQGPPAAPWPDPVH